jgi:signal peptidase II
VNGSERHERRRVPWLLLGLTALAVLAVSQAVSYVVQARLPLYETYVVNRVLHLTHIRNTGGVFGLLPGNSALFVAVSGVIIAALVVFVMRARPHATYQYVCFGLVIGAAAANVCDRLVYGAVIDFIDIQGIPRWHYIFNVADVAIHVGAWPLALATLFGQNPEGTDGHGSSA